MEFPALPQEETKSTSQTLFWLIHSFVTQEKGEDHGDVEQERAARHDGGNPCVDLVFNG